MPASPKTSIRRTLAGSLALAALSIAACGGDTDVNAGPTCDKPKTAFEQPTTELTFRAAGASAAQLDETVRILCERLAASGTAHRVHRTAGDRIAVQLPARSQLARESADASVFGPGRFAYYDWEANVVGPDGKVAPRDRTVTGGVGAGEFGSLTHYDAVLRAAWRPATAEADNGVVGSRFYAVDPTARHVLNTAPTATRAAALAALAPGLRSTAKVHEVKPGTVLVRTDDLPFAATDDRWYVLRDDVALRGGEIVRARAIRDPAARPPEPVVAYELTAEGRRAWTRLSTEVIERGKRNARPGEPPQVGFQHFAWVLDDRLLGIPFLDYRAAADELPPEAGSVVGAGLTIASARQLAAVLDSGPLPRALVPASSG